MLSLFRNASSKATTSISRCQSTLVVVEHDGKRILPTTKHAITAARRIGGEISCLIAGPNVKIPTSHASTIKGISKLLVCEDEKYTGFMPERMTALLKAAYDQFQFSHVIAGSSAFSRGLLPRFAAKSYIEFTY